MRHFLEVASLREQNTKLRHQLKNVQAKRDHHLRERDRYRDLYNNALKQLQAARHPNF